MKQAGVSNTLCGLIAAFCCLLLAAGCIDELEFDVERSGNQLVVSGRIYDRPGPYELELGITTNESTLPRPLRGAEVTIFDGSGNKEMYEEADNGTYILQGNSITGKRGESYHIEIKTGDRIYRSIPETIPMAHSRDNVYFEAVNLQEPTASGRTIDIPAISIYADTQIPELPDPLFIRWEVHSVYSFIETEIIHPLAPPPTECYIYGVPDPQRISIFSSTDSGSNEIRNQLLAQKRIISHEFFRRHYFNVVSSSITERRFNYWKHVDEMINQSGTIFDAPPATPLGNIYNRDDDTDRALGYFEASAIDTARTFVTRGDVPVNVYNPCAGSSQHFACDNCLKIDNSTLDRPPYF